MANKTIAVVIGTNEHFVVGYRLTLKKNEKLSFKKMFAEYAHTASVRQLCISGKYLVTGAADELIKVYDLFKNREVGIIEKHEGTITSLAFHKKKYLFSGGQDGNICIYNVNNWKCEKTLVAHRGGVTGLAVHPSGKLALSVGQDKSLKTWNLIKGRKAFVTNLGIVSNGVYWTPSGTHFLVIKGSCMDIYEISSCKEIKSVDFKENIHAVCFVTEDIIAVGGEGKNICLYDITNLMELNQWPAHDMRIKSLCKVSRTGTEEVWLVSASSDGTMKVWSLKLLSIQEKPKLLGETNTACRIICMDIFIGRQMEAKAEEMTEETESVQPEAASEEVQDDEGKDESGEGEDSEEGDEEEGSEEGSEEGEEEEESDENEEDSDSQESYMEEEDLEHFEEDIAKALSKEENDIRLKDEVSAKINGKSEKRKESSKNSNGDSMPVKTTKKIKIK